MAAKKRKSFLLRLDPEVWRQLERWSQDELRSVNGHIEYLLREALQRSGRGKPPKDQPSTE